MAAASSPTADQPDPEVPAEPLVSVVVPVYNCERYLAESLDSILAQTHRNLEVIVVDDASTDRSAGIAAEFAARDARVRLERQPRNVGQFPNVNAGLELARGEFIAVYHGDDAYDAAIVARELEWLRAHPDVGAVFALVVFIDGESREFGRIAPLPPEIASAESLDYPLILNALLRHMGSFLPTPTALVKREVYAEVGGYRSDYGLRGDLDMWLRIAERYPLGLVQEHLARYRAGHDNETRRYDQLRTEPELFFALMDDRLAAGDRRVAEPDALAAYEAHRATDILLLAANAYILGRRSTLRELLRRVDSRRLIASRRVQRWRMLVLWAMLSALARLPRSSLVAAVFRRRWHAAVGGAAGSSQPARLVEEKMPQ